MGRQTLQPASFFSRNPVTSFISLTFIISYFLGIPFNMLISPLVKDTNEVSSVLLPRTVTVYGPAIAAVVLAFLGVGPVDTKTLMYKLTPPTRNAWWLAIPFICILISFSSFAFAGVSFAQLGGFLVEDWKWLLLHLIGQLFIVGIGEELGWRGWLLPTLAQRHSLGVCALLITAIWGLWHLPIFFSGHEVLIPWLMMLTAMAFLTTWLWYKVDGNIFVLAIMHASFNASEAFLENRLNNLERDKKIVLAGWETLGYVYLLIALIVAVADRKVWTTRLP